MLKDNANILFGHSVWEKSPLRKKSTRRLYTSVRFNGIHCMYININYYYTVFIHIYKYVLETRKVYFLKKKKIWEIQYYNIVQILNKDWMPKQKFLKVPLKILAFPNIKQFFKKFVFS